MKRIVSIVLALLVTGCAVVPVGQKGVNNVVLVCHKGNQTLELPEPAVRAHLNHGDYLGRCRL